MSSGGEQQTFDLATFETLQGEELYAYMEPIVCSLNAVVEADDLERMARKLSEYVDEYHLVYAIELGADHSPEVFAELIPKYLSHSEQSVRLATSRALGRLPERVITMRLLGAVETSLKSCPESSRMKKLTDRFKAILKP